MEISRDNRSFIEIGVMIMTTNELSLNLEKNNELVITENAKNIFTNISDAFSSAVDKGIDLLNIPNNALDKVKDGFKKFNLKDVASSAAQSALKTGMKSLGMKVSTFNSLKGIFDAVKEGNLKDGLSSALSAGISFLKVPTNVKSFLNSSKNLILDKAFEDELKIIMKKQQNTISRINKKCDQIEKAINNGEISSIEKTIKTLKTDLNKVMPIQNVIERGNSIVNQYELIKNKGDILTSDEKELCAKLA